MPPNETELFLKDIQSEESTDPFAGIEAQSNDDAYAPTSEDTDEDTDEDYNPKNRRERRLTQRLQEERESGIALAARLEAITEAQTAREAKGEADSALNAIERIYGTESPEAREATEILKAALMEVRTSAKQDALSEIQSNYDNEANAVSEAENTLDYMLEEIEDEFNVDLSSARGAKARTDFYTLLERMSPKDREGNITSYADHISVWEEYQDRAARVPDQTAKNLAARSMTQSSGSSGDDLETNTNERYLREHGII